MVIKNKRIIVNPVSILLIIVSLVLFGMGLFSGIFTYTAERTGLTQHMFFGLYCENGHLVDKGLITKQIRYCSICGAEAGFLKQHMTCANCGKYIEDTAKYCKYCGRENQGINVLMEPLVSDNSLILYWLAFIIFLFSTLTHLSQCNVVITRNRVEGIAVYGKDELAGDLTTSQE